MNSYSYTVLGCSVGAEVSTMDVGGDAAFGLILDFGVDLTVDCSGIGEHRDGD